MSGRTEERRKKGEGKERRGRKLEKTSWERMKERKK